MAVYVTRAKALTHFTEGNHKRLGFIAKTTIDLSLKKQVDIFKKNERQEPKEHHYCGTEV